MPHQNTSRHQRAIQPFVQKRLALALAAAFSMPAIAATSVTWDGGGGNSFWDVAKNWSTNQRPDASNDVSIGAVNVVFQNSIDASINSLTVATGGSLVIQGKSLDIAAASNVSQLMMTAGTLKGSGVVSVAQAKLSGTVIHDGAGTTRLMQNGNHSIDGTLKLTGGRTLQNEGDLLVGGNTTAEIRLNSHSAAAKLVNQKLMTLKGTTVISADYLDGSAAFENNGTLIKDGLAQSTIFAKFINNKTLTLNGGIVAIQNGSEFSGNSIVDGSGVLELSTWDNALRASYVHSFSDGFSSDASIRLSGNYAVMKVDSGHVRLGSFLHSGGTIQGNGQLELGNAKLAGNVIVHDGAGTTRLMQNGNHSIDGTLKLTGGRALQNDGDLVVGGNTTAEIRLNSHSAAAKLVNQKLMTLKGTTVISADYLDGSAVFENNGTLIKDGSAQSTIFAKFINNKTLTLNGGIVAIQNGSEFSGNSIVDGSGVLELSTWDNALRASYVHSFADGFNSDTLIQLNGKYVVMKVDSGHVRMGNFAHSGGTVQGKGQLELGNAHLSGTISHDGTGTTKLLQNGNHSIDGTLRLTGGRTLQNDGNLVVGGTNYTTIRLNDRRDDGISSKLHNNGTMIIHGASQIIHNYTDGDAIFVNQGRFIKDGVGNATINAKFDNGGSVYVKSGLLAISGGDQVNPLLIKNGKEIVVSSGAVLSLENETDLVNDGRLMIGGAVHVLNVRQPHSSIVGNYTQGSVGHLDIGLAGGVNGLLDVSGKATLNGVLDVTHLADYAPKIGDSFIVLASSRLYGAFSSLALHGFGSGTQINVSYLDGNDADSYADYVRLDVAAVPEPETYAMMLAGLGVVGWSLRKRKLAMQ